MSKKKLFAIILIIVIPIVGISAYNTGNQTNESAPNFFALTFTNFTYEMTHEYTIYSPTSTRYQVDFVLTNTEHSDETVHNITLTYLPWSQGYWLNGIVNGEWISGQPETIYLGDIAVGQSIPVRMHDIHIRDVFTTQNGNAGSLAFYFEFRSSDYTDQGNYNSPSKNYKYIEVKYYDEEKILDAALSRTSFNGEESVRMLCWQNPS